MDTPYRIAKLIFLSVFLYVVIQIGLYLFGSDSKDEIATPVSQELINEETIQDDSEDYSEEEEEDSVEEPNEVSSPVVYNRFYGFEKDENGKLVEVFKKEDFYGNEIKETENNNSVEALQSQVKELNQKVSSMEQGRRPGTIKNVHGEIIYQGEEE